MKRVESPPENQFLAVAVRKAVGIVGMLHRRNEGLFHRPLFAVALKK